MGWWTRCDSQGLDGKARLLHNHNRPPCLAVAGTGDDLQPDDGAAMAAAVVRKPDFILFLLLLALAIPLEIACAFLAYETLGEIHRGVYFLAIGLNLAFVVVAFRYRMAAAIGVLVLALAIVPYQLRLGHRLLRVQAEAACIVGWAYDQKLAVGSFPANLSAYGFRDPATKRFIQSYGRSPDRGGFLLIYRVGTETTSHWYCPKDGWNYYPD